MRRDEVERILGVSGRRARDGDLSVEAQRATRCRASELLSAERQRQIAWDGQWAPGWAGRMAAAVALLVVAACGVAVWPRFRAAESDAPGPDASLSVVSAVHPTVDQIERLERGLTEDAAAFRQRLRHVGDGSSLEARTGHLRDGIRRQIRALEDEIGDLVASGETHG